MVGPVICSWTSCSLNLSFYKEVQHAHISLIWTVGQQKGAQTQKETLGLYKISAAWTGATPTRQTCTQFSFNKSNGLLWTRCLVFSTSDLEELSDLFRVQLQSGQRQLEGRSLFTSLLHVTQRQGAVPGWKRGRYSSTEQCGVHNLKSTAD